MKQQTRAGVIRRLKIESRKHKASRFVKRRAFNFFYFFFSFFKRAVSQPVQKTLVVLLNLDISTYNLFLVSQLYNTINLLC